MAETRFEGRRAEIRQWRTIIRSDEVLLERDLRKRAALNEAILLGLIGRNIEPSAARPFAELSVTLLQVALERWLDSAEERTLFETVLDTLRCLQSAAASFPTGAGATH